MDLRVGVSAVAMNWLIMLYFIILFAERVQSIVRSIRDKDVKLFGSGFDSYVYLAVFLSLAAFLVLLAVGNAAFLQSLFTMDMNVYRSIDYRMLSITVGVILVSGMVHTEYTIPGIQFASYGMLIAALVIKTACVNAQAEDRVLLWMSLIYLILFSMAIPVMYHSEIEKAILFHVIEAVVSLALVAAFAVSDGVVSGTTGQAKRLEAIEIKLTGELAEKYDVYYRVHAQTFGWLNWAKNGQTAGTVGYAKRLEGIQIVLVPKGGKAPSATPLNDGRACIIK